MTLERKRLAVSGGDLAYVDEGEGPAVLLVHGFPTSAHLWRDLVPMLAPRCRVIAPDLLGYGGSEKPEDARLDIRAQAAYVGELLQHLGVERLALVGHDIGGGVAQLLALEREVDALVLIDAIAFDAWPIQGVRMIQGTAEEAADVALAEQLVRVSFDVGMSHRDRLGEDDLEAFIAPWRSDPPALIRAARGIDGLGLVGIEGRLGSLDIPSLVLWGEDDPFLPPELAERLGEALARATVALLPAVSHFVTEDVPETAVPLVFEFLRSQYLGEPRMHSSAPVEVTFERPDRPAAPEGFEDFEER